MGNLGRGYSFGATEEVTAAKLHSLIDSGTVTDIVAADITDSVITDAKMVSVAGSKLITLSGIPAGAGNIPAANLGNSDWQVLADVTVSSNCDYVDITGLDINTDKFYTLYLTLKNSADSTCAYHIFVEEDYTTTNYYSQSFQVLLQLIL